ncbi:hypothetical protein JX266_010465 [Neoarthrinium moseri]|nr:hypothetical protein JX266_010465 [Neoarthrinium moseri]
MSSNPLVLSAEAQQELEKELKAEDVFEQHILAKYDPEAVKIVLRGVNAGVPPVDAVPIEERRANPDKYRPPWSQDTTGWERVVDSHIISDDGAEVPIRIYHPDPEVNGNGPYGVHLNFHGGGYVFGDLDNESTICASMRDGAGIVVVDVNYRHCPEVVWGKAIEDAWAALQWARKSARSLNIDPSSVSVGGISAGGNICLILQHMARDNGLPLKLCLPTVPGTSTCLAYKFHTDSPFLSFHQFYNGPVLPWSAIKYFGDYCFPKDKLDERMALVPGWWASPLEAKNWVGLCETYLRTAECDPLRDEGEAYGIKLIAGGNKVTIKRYIGCPHTFMFWKDFKQKQEWDADSIQALKRAHGKA